MIKKKNICFVKVRNLSQSENLNCNQNFKFCHVICKNTFNWFTDDVQYRYLCSHSLLYLLFVESDICFIYFRAMLGNQPVAPFGMEIGEDGHHEVENYEVRLVPISVARLVPISVTGLVLPYY